MKGQIWSLGVPHTENMKEAKLTRWEVSQDWRQGANWEAQ